MEQIGYFITSIVLIIGSALWRGYVLSSLWAWFIVTTFGAPPLGIAAAIGFSNIVGFLTYQYHRDAMDTCSYAEKLIEGFCIALIWPLVALIMGAIVRHWL